ncbi:ABC transporter permease [Desertimonas flava]|jgi:peptide/nickel transport system permease protein|uniref:ABC transporter permease n=1 Tax=Desertimonas flava TaxID=2064846 RepID=UPI000E3559CD|nr:ABC transporter permease [Desertimonas flava]
MKSRTIARRLIAMVPMLLLVALMIFSITYLVPGDAAATIAGDGASVEDIARIRRELGLDRSFIVQFTSWLGDLFRGDLGTSLTTGRSVWNVIWNRAPVSLSLGISGMIVGIVLGTTLGVIAGTKVRSVRDRAAIVAASFGVAMPNFWLGLLLVTVFAVNLGWFPATGYVGPTENFGEFIRHLVLPAVALGCATAAEISRQTRASLAQTLELDYVRTARMKGLPRRLVVGKHALKNAASPVVTTIGLQATVLLGGTVIVERVFGIAGLGTSAIEAVSARDIPLIQGIVLVTTLSAILVNLAVDLVQMYLNPKVTMS